MFVTVDDTDYVGNHVYNYLREYLFDHVGEFYVKQDYKNPDFKCSSREISYKDRHLSFPIPYGQYYCFYDDSERPDPNETCYILDVCECALRMVLDEEYALKIESFKELPMKDRLTKDSKFFYLDGGFMDTFVWYFYCINHNIFPIACSRKQKELREKNELGQSNSNILKFGCKNLLTTPKIMNFIKKCCCESEVWKYLYNNRRSFNEILNTILTKYIYEKNVIHNINKYALLGMRMNYVSNYNNSFTQLHQKIDIITNYIRNNEEIVLVIDDRRFLKLFFMTFYDVLRGKRIVMFNYGVDDIYEMIMTYRTYKSFYYIFSSFYDLIKIVHETFY